MGKKEPLVYQVTTRYVVKQYYKEEILCEKICIDDVIVFGLFTEARSIKSGLKLLIGQITGLVSDRYVNSF